MPSPSNRLDAGIPRLPSLRGTGRPGGPPVPPVELPPAHTATVPGRGEVFYRDSGGTGPVVLLLHGWVVTGDLNWAEMYAPLREAGHRVVWLDHRGHGRGLRATVPFRLADCADDAAGLLRVLGCGPAIVVGYSMGGAIAQLLAQRHRELVAGLVVSATALEWNDPRTRIAWRFMGLMRLLLSVFPYFVWRGLVRPVGYGPSTAEWVAGELLRGSARDLAEAGKEMGRFDSSSWAPALGVPAAMIVTTRDRDVPPRKQYALGEALGAHVFEIAGHHLAVADRRFGDVLVPAVARVAAEAAAGPGREAA